ncbi:MAG: nitroreductase family protein [Nitrososphaerales archaeon]
MEFRRLLRDRHSVRSFRSDDVEQEKVLRILQDAIRSPSAGNLQSWEFILVRDEGVKKRLAEAALDQDFIAEAPVVLVVCADAERSGWRYGERGRSFYCLIDTSMASMIILLSAVEEGLGACFVAAFDDREVSEILSLPKKIRPIGIIPLGYSGEAPDITSRMPLDRVLHIERW